MQPLAVQPRAVVSFERGEFGQAGCCRSSASPGSALGGPVWWSKVSKRVQFEQRRWLIIVQLLVNDSSRTGLDLAFEILI